MGVHFIDKETETQRDRCHTAITRGSQNLIARNLVMLIVFIHKQTRELFELQYCEF